MRRQEQPAPAPCLTAPAIDFGGRWREETSTPFAAWVLVAFFEAACWALVVVANKKVLAYVTPLQVNLLVRCVSIVGLLVITVPFTVFGWWSLDFGLTGRAAVYIAGSAALTWVISFNAYYYALRAGRASVVAPVTSTDPIWTALFAPLILGVALTLPTVAGLVVATVGVALISLWMEPGGEAAAAVDVGWAVTPGEQRAAGEPAQTRRLTVILLSVTTAAGWGLAPVIIELAERDNGAPAPG